MKNRPKLLTALGVGLAAIAISLPIQIMLLFGYFPHELGAALARLAPMNWVILSLSLFAAWLCPRASRLLLGALPALAAAILYNNWLVAASGLNYSSPVAWLSAIAAASLACYPMTRPEIRALLLKPQLRWWLTPRRHRISIPLTLEWLAPERGELQALTFDLSEKGAYLPLRLLRPQRSDAPSAAKLGELKVGMQFRAVVPLHGGARPIRCQAEVVRLCRGAGKYPDGVGIRFVGLGFRDSWSLSSFLRQAA